MEEIVKGMSIGGISSPVEGKKGSEHDDLQSERHSHRIINPSNPRIIRRGLEDGEGPVLLVLTEEELDYDSGKIRKRKRGNNVRRRVKGGRRGMNEDQEMLARTLEAGGGEQVG